MMNIAASEVAAVTKISQEYVFPDLFCIFASVNNSLL